MLIAGSLAEEVVLGHHLELGYIGDLRVFRLGVGLLEASTQMELEEVLGQPHREVILAVQGWLASAYPRIRRVTEALVGRSNEQHPLLIKYDAGPWTLTYDEVVALVA